MIRTQIYLPQETHQGLQKLAKQSKRTLSQLIRKGAEEVLNKSYGNDSPQRHALKRLVLLASSYKIKLPTDAVTLIRRERDEP